MPKIDFFERSQNENKRRAKKHIPLKIKNNHPPLSSLRRRHISLPLSSHRHLPHRDRQPRAIHCGNALFAPHHGAALGGVVGDALRPRKWRHGRHVDDAVLEQDQHNAFVAPEHEQQRGEDEGWCQSGGEVEGAAGWKAMEKAMGEQEREWRGVQWGFCGGGFDKSE